MDLSRPMRVVTASLDGDLLAVLAGGDHAFTGRQLARLAGASSEGARVALARLVTQGIVRREPVGAAHLYRLNREHLAAPLVVALTDLRGELIRRLKAALTDWEPAPVYVALFGSVARGQARADSDLDLCVVRPTGVAADDAAWRAQVLDLESAGSRWTGNDTRVLELTPQDVAALDPQSVVDDVLRDGIPLFADPSVLRRLRAGHVVPDL